MALVRQISFILFKLRKIDLFASIDIYCNIALFHDLQSRLTTISLEI